MAYKFILSEQGTDGIVTLTINNPDSKNAVNPQMNAEIRTELDRIESDDRARVLIVTGQGRIFCSGASVKHLAGSGMVADPAAIRLRDTLHPHQADMRGVVVGLRQLSKPAIAAINGAAMGSGVGIAAGCDIRIASSTAKIGWVFTRRGLVPDDASLFLMQQLIGYGRAFEWGITGRTLDAVEAHRIGFLNEVVPAEQVLARCRELALEIIQNAPPITAQLFKMSLGEAVESSLENAVRFTERAQRIARATEDQKEAILAFSEKRAPVWKGK